MQKTMDKQKQAFLLEMMQVQKEMNQAGQQVRIYEGEIYSLKRNIKKNELTLKQIQNLKTARTIYIPLGKAFVAKPHQAIKKQFNEINKKYENDIKECQKTKAYYEQKRKQKQKIVKEGIQKIMKK